MKNKLGKRFVELEEQLEKVGKTKFTRRSPINHRDTYYVDAEALTEWRIKAGNLLVKACGPESTHYQSFKIIEKKSGVWSNYYNTTYKPLRAIFRAAKEDFEGGYVVSIKSLIQAEVFESQLEQAEELLSSGYDLAAAVTAGVVLETGLRELCDRNSIPYGKLDKMNADLRKAGVYNKLQQKRITALADIRNSAAHGRVQDFKKEDVEMMIRDVTQFLSNYLTN